MNLDPPEDQRTPSGRFIQIPICDEEFSALKELVYTCTGIHLTDQKRALLMARLQGVLNRRGFTSFGDYYAYVVNDTTGQAITELVDRITTKHTFFFRENDLFDDIMESVFPQIVQKPERQKDKDLRIWCAGCATGEEAYTLMMRIMEYFADEYASWNAGILATDISTDALDAARKGVYSDESLQRVPDRYRLKFFDRLPDGDWKVKEVIRREVTFRRFNLTNDTFPFKRPFDLVFCRNVMIYFDQPLRQSLCSRFHDSTEPGGYLVVSRSESLLGWQSRYKHVLPGIYRRGGE